MMRKRQAVEEIAIIGGLIAMQFVYAGNNIVLSFLMSLGFQSSTLIIISSFATFIILFPLAFLFERAKWPNKFSSKLMFQLVLISFGGVTLFQSLLLKGIKLTSPAMATAMPNLAPGLIFIIAWAFGLEKVKLSCIYSRVKIVGTLLCVTGAIAMSIAQSTTHINLDKEGIFPPSPANYSFLDKDKIVGCMYLMAAVFILSSMIVLQATTLSDFPAPISFCAITSIIGVILTLLVELIQKHQLIAGLPVLSVGDFIGYSLLAGTISGAAVSFNAWAMKKRGPVLVSMFSPISAVISVILSATLGDSVTLGSLTGMFLMFTGLYFVLWAKGKENFSIASESEYVVEEPLLC